MRRKRKERREMRVHDGVEVRVNVEENGWGIFLAKKVRRVQVGGVEEV